MLILTLCLYISSVSFVTYTASVHVNFLILIKYAKEMYLHIRPCFYIIYFAYCVMHWAFSFDSITASIFHIFPFRYMHNIDDFTYYFYFVYFL